MAIARAQDNHCFPVLFAEGVKIEMRFAVGGISSGFM
jgi:hypothetical protein